MALALFAVATSGCGASNSSGNTGPKTREPRAARLTLDLGVRQRASVTDLHPTPPFAARVRVKRGTVVAFRARVFNAGTMQARHVWARAQLPAGFRLIGASEFIKPVTVSVANGNPLPGDLRRGVHIGPYPSHASFDLAFAAKVTGSAPTGRSVTRLTVRGAGFTTRDSVTVLVGK